MIYKKGTRSWIIYPAVFPPKIGRALSNQESFETTYLVLLNLWGWYALSLLQLEIYSALRRILTYENQICPNGMTMQSLLMLLQLSIYGLKLALRLELSKSSRSLNWICCWNLSSSYKFPSFQEGYFLPANFAAACRRIENRNTWHVLQIFVLIECKQVPAHAV